MFSPNPVGQSPLDLKVGTRHHRRLALLLLLLLSPPPPSPPAAATAPADIQAQYNPHAMYRYYGAPSVAFREGVLAGHNLGAGEASQAPAVSAAQAAPWKTGALAPHDLVSGLTASDAEHHAQVAAVKAPNGMAPATAATFMHHAEMNAHFGHPLPRNAPRKFAKKIPKQPICEVCNFQSNGLHDLRIHETGKKHKKNLEKLQDSITPKQENPLNGAVGTSTSPAAAVADSVMPAAQSKKNKRSAASPEDLEVKKRRVLEAGTAEGEPKICTMSNVVKKIPKVVQPVTCEVCKIQCTSLDNFRGHERGKKHIANMKAHFGHPLPRNAPRKFVEKIPKQPTTCEVCNFQLTGQHDLRYHETGKKHKKNLEKLQDLITPKQENPLNGAVGTSTSPAAAVANSVMPAAQSKKNKRSAATLEDLEVKKRRVLEAGTTEGEPKICTMSNVVKKIPKVVQPLTCEVCKTQFRSLNNLRFHESSKKHKKNLEKLQDSMTSAPAKPPKGAVGATTEPASAAVADGVTPAAQPKNNKTPQQTQKN